MERPSNQSAREIWDRIAGWWDDQIGAEGNDFHRVLIEPATDRLLRSAAGMRVLDLACGNGQYARHLARTGCDALAIDGSAAFIERARARSHDLPIDYRVIDLTDDAQLATINGPFDGVICTMALMDIPEIAPLFRAVARVLKPGGPFVFSVPHPCFNSGNVHMVAELISDSGRLRQVYGIHVSDYIAPRTEFSAGILNQPEPHYFFHRPISVLLRYAFENGFVLDGLEEPTFPASTPAKNAFSWAKRTSLPPAIVIRARK